ncbi:hypothetical protein FRC00_002894 [Tulasnella sp. 408]|nr:hypothetical protein FRC00_002894 [Tulasnella sp. 408]
MRSSKKGSWSFASASPSRPVAQTNFFGAPSGGLFGAPAQQPAPTPRPPSPTPLQKTTVQIQAATAAPAGQSHGNAKPMEETSESEPEPSPVGSPRSWGPPPTMGGQTKGFADDATLGEYAECSHALLEILKDLHSTGIQNELDLPKIVVVGSQSVGKSSLIESMSGVVLRFQYDASGKLRNEMREVPFGAVIYDKDEVTERLERAQLAILNPSARSESFLSGDYEPTAETLTFSANCVCVRVAGPNVPDLYFYDLPGVIANVSDGGKEADIELVDKLAISYVSRPNCLVLLVITCDSVLTKVDRIQPGDEDRWLKILRGEELVLRNGWYCVKQRGPKELESGVSWEDAKTQEQAFFTTEAPWCDLGDSLSGRVGSEALSSELGRTLSKLVSRELPKIQAQVITQLSEAKASLAKLAPLNVEQPQTEVIRLLQEFNRSLTKHIDGVPPAIPAFDKPSQDSDNAPADGLMNTLNTSYDKFRHRIRDTAPHFKPWSSKRQTKEGEADPMAGIKLDDDILGASSARVFYLDEVMDLAQRSRTRELPGNFPFSVKEALINQSTRSWRDIATECFQEVWDRMVEHVNRLIEDHFGRYTRGGLKVDVQAIILSHMQELAKAAMQKVEGLVQTEDAPYTQNDHYFFDYRTKLLLRYKAAHRKSKSQSSVIQSLQDHDLSRKPQRSTDAQTQWQNINEVLSGLATIGIPGIIATDLIKLLPDDNMGPAFEIMAEVRAYFQVAYKRFSDNVPKQIDTDFVRGITKNLDVVLLSRMMNNLTETRCREYLEEPPEIVGKRKELEARIKRLQAAKDRLLEFNQSYDQGFLRASFDA